MHWSPFSWLVCSAPMTAVGVWSAIGFIAQALTLDNNAAGKVSFFSSLSVVIPPLLDVIFRPSSTSSSSSQSVTRKKNMLRDIISSPFIAPLIAVAGAMVMEWDSFHDAGFGDLFLLMAPLAFALAFWRSESLAIKFSDEDFTAVTGILLLTVAGISCGWACLAGDMPVSGAQASSLLRMMSSDTNILSGMLTTGLLATAWTSFMEQSALRIVSAAEMTMIYSFEPIFASIFAWIFANEVISHKLVIGAVFVMLACAWDNSREMMAKAFEKMTGHRSSSATSDKQHND
jgi:drug/metabolite transporter (DMT)-like permease